jgi:hypothetical protein
VRQPEGTARCRDASVGMYGSTKPRGRFLRYGTAKTRAACARACNIAEAGDIQDKVHAVRVAMLSCLPQALTLPLRNRISARPAGSSQMNLLQFTVFTEAV